MSERRRDVGIEGGWRDELCGPAQILMGMQSEETEQERGTDRLTSSALMEGIGLNP